MAIVTIYQTQIRLILQIFYSITRIEEYYG
nr:MAG TPA: hypothetical protein [Bacteriophage sp.]